MPPVNGRPITMERIVRALARRARVLRRRFRRSFRRGVENPDVPLSLDMGSDSRTLLIAFGGMRGELGIPPFEFFKATGEFPIKRLFVRDLSQAWYHRGIPGGGSTIPEMADSLQALIAQHEVERLVVAGTSAGGYAALVFGSLLGADRAICFAPQTVLELPALAAMNDHRWDRQVEELLANGGLDPRWTDLRDALPGARCTDTRYELHYDPSFAPDRAHCEHLAGLDGVELRPRAGGGHNIARDMREAGELERLLRSALETLPADSAAGTSRGGSFVAPQ
jgi:pimeloyl-ACP methyl ester carboxylesterase